VPDGWRRRNTCAADAHTNILHGPEPAKRWLQQAIIAPLKRAGSSGSTCMAAGFCSRALLLHGPAASGKTELVHALAAEMGGSLLYISSEDSLLKTCQEQGHRLLRAIFKVSRGVSVSG
jgi:ATP-dependent 26S proteasome regulatory subunit